MIIHDMAIQSLPVRMCMDRGGLSGDDGPTHHGLFDIAYLRAIPGLVHMQPKDEDEFVDMLWTMAQYDKGPSPSVIPAAPALACNRRSAATARDRQGGSDRRWLRHRPFRTRKYVRDGGEGARPTRRDGLFRRPHQSALDQASRQGLHRKIRTPMRSRAHPRGSHPHERLRRRDHRAPQRRGHRLPGGADRLAGRIRRARSPRHPPREARSDRRERG
jgi:hypothetical protein